MRSLLATILILGIAGSALAEDIPFSVTHKMEGYVTYFKVISPEGATCHVKSDSSWFGEKDFEVPFNFKAQAKFYYTFDCDLPSGQHWHKKLQPKAQYSNIIKIGEGDAAAPASKPAASGGDFQQLLKSIQNADFAAEKKRILKMGVRGRRFSCKQVGQLIDAFDFSEGKVFVVQMTAKLLSDPGNSFQILEHFEFEADKQKAQALLQ